MSRRLVLILLLMLLSLSAQAQPGNPDGPEHRMRLTGAQRQQLREIRGRYKQLRQPNQVAIKAKRLELMQLLAQDQPDKTAVNAKVREIMELQNQYQQTLVDELFEIRAILTPEQWKNVRSRMIDEML